MSNCRSIIYLLIGIVAASLVYVLCPSRVSMRNMRVLVNTLIPATARYSQIIIERFNSPRVVLERRDDWHLILPYEGAANGKVIAKLLDALAFTPVTDVMAISSLTKLGKSIDDLGLNNPALTVTLTHAAKLSRIRFGNLTAASNEVYVAIDGIDAVETIPLAVFNAVNLTAEQLRERALLNMDSDSVDSFSIKNANAALVEFNRRDGGWFANNQLVSAGKVKDFLAHFTSAEAHSFVWPVGNTNEQVNATASQLAAYGFESESLATITFRDLAATVVRIDFGGAASSNTVYASAWNNTAVVTVDAALKEMVIKGLSGFVDSRLFPVEISEVKSFSVNSAKGDCTIVFNAQENRWQMVSPIVASADLTVVNKCIAQLSRLTAVDRAPNGVRVSINTNSVSEMVESSAMRGFEPLTFRSRELLNIDKASIKRLLSVRANDGDRHKSVVYSADRRAWSVEEGVNGVANESAIAAILKVLSPLTALRNVSLKASAAELSGYGFDHPWLIFAIDQVQSNSVRCNLLVGAETDGGRYVTIGASGEVFVLAKEVIEVLASALITE